MVPNPDDVKRKRESSYDNFQKPQKKNKPSTPTSKKANGPTRRPFVPISHLELKMRKTLEDLCYALEWLDDAQVSAITDMGFQSILSLKIPFINTWLGYCLLVNYDHKLNELNLGCRRIKITPSKVREVFGIPMGRRTIIEMNNSRQCVHPTVCQFRRQFKQKRIRVKDVIKELRANKDGGRLFKLNFLVLFNTVLGKTTTNGTVNQTFLTSIVDDSDICNMNWCSYMITCLNRTKEKWYGGSHYNGPILLLVLVYAHDHLLRHGKIHEPAKTPAISYISIEDLRDVREFVYANRKLTDDNIEADEPQTKSHDEDGELQTKSPNEASGVQTEGQNTVVVKTTNQDESENQYQDQAQGDKFQSDKDQRVTQGEEGNHAIHSKQHGLILQMPIGTHTNRVIDDCITPPSLQSPSGMPAFLGHRDIPETPVDASSLDLVGNVEHLDPKQDQLRLVENVSPLSDSVEKLSSPLSDIICVQGYKVKRGIVPILEAIFNKHGDIAANCIVKTSSARTYFLEVVCEVVRRIQTNDMTEIGEEIEGQLLDAEAVNIDVSWLRAHFEVINKRKETSKKCSLLMAMKANTILVKRAAQMDLRETSVELVAAQERFKEAERCVRVLHLVEKNLSDNILESKGKRDSWVKHPVV